MPDIKFENLLEAFKAGLESEVQDFYKKQGKQMLEEDKALVSELATESASITLKLLVAKATGDAALTAGYLKDLEFIKSTLVLRLAKRTLQINKATEKAFISLITNVLGSLGAALPKLLLNAL